MNGKLLENVLVNKMSNFSNQNLKTMENQKDDEPQVFVTLKKDEGAPSSSDKSTDYKNPQSKIARGTKKMRIDSTDFNQPTEKKETKDDEGETKIEPKIDKNVRSFKRSCELWSLEDKNTFFKAVNEFGKDFDALQAYFQSQGKKKGLPETMIKNKEQIRHFYYRTWLKISKHLKFSEDVKKATQEIYGLINYGELRRKLPRIHEKVLLKLNELIFWGSTQVRLRGKTMRIKTPICRALRKLNQLEDWQEEIKLPSRVTVELRPANNSTWWEVQAHAMNPRVRTLLPIQRRLSTLLAFLQQRWKPAKYRVSPNFENEVLDQKDPKLLRVAPQEGIKIALPMVNLGEYLTSNSVSFNSYEGRLGLKSSRVELLGSVQHLKGVGKKSIKKKTDKRTQSLTEECPVSLLYTNNDLDGTESSVNPEKNLFASHLEKHPVETSMEPNRYPGRETVERIREGWTIDEANSITVGDLLLMFGREGKITLEYWWDVPGGSDGARERARQTDGLALALKKLLSIAKHNYGTSKAYENAGSNETVISSRIPSAKESTFRRPLIPQPYHQIGSHDAFKTQLDKFKTRFSKRGRTVRQRSLIVQRTIPVVVRQEEVQMEADRAGHEASPTIELNQPSGEFLTALGGSSEASNSIITSATQILKEGEGQWLNSEVADYSLSSFLGQFESPVKGFQRSNAGTSLGDGRPSSDVVSQMQCLMGESSVDYMAKFANLASQIASDEQDT
ncbi:protein cramped [Diachasmimorpha longicaudata]|uniref:protein cramped n=1 Tax=Diachasmimorpha longicaudata TaxID=58733 RepID=UPI0030B89995